MNYKINAVDSSVTFMQIKEPYLPQFPYTCINNSNLRVSRLGDWIGIKVEFSYIKSGQYRHVPSGSSSVAFTYTPECVSDRVAKAV